MDRAASHVPPSGHWRVAVVEDHLLQRRGLVSVLAGQPGLRVVFESETLPQFLAWLSAKGPSVRPDLLVLDLLVDRGPSVEPDVVRKLIHAGIKVVVVSAMSSPPLVRRVIGAGVTGVVGKRDSPDDLVAAVWTVLSQGRWMTSELGEILAPDEHRPALSDQEERVLVLYASGHTLDQVAVALGVKRDTAKTYLDRVKQKYAAIGRPVRTKVELARAALADGFLDAIPRETKRHR